MPTKGMENFLGSAILIVLIFPTLYYSRAFADVIIANPATDAITKIAVGWVPLLLVVVLIVFAVLLLYKAVT